MIIKKRINQILFAAVAAFSLAAGYWLNQSGQSANLPTIPNDFEATVFPEARQLIPFKLIDQDGKSFTPQRLENKWSMLFFGYTHCPDVCPTTLKVLQDFWRELPENVRSQTQVAFISVDPKRDTPAIIKEYVRFFEPTFLGITGNLGQITAFTRSLGILYEYVSVDKDKNNYGVNHSAQIILIDPQARMRAIFPPPHDPDEMRTNFLKIVEFYSK